MIPSCKTTIILLYPELNASALEGVRIGLVWGLCGTPMHWPPWRRAEITQFKDSIAPRSPVAPLNYISNSPILVSLFRPFAFVFS